MWQIHAKPSICKLDGSDEAHKDSQGFFQKPPCLIETFLVITSCLAWLKLLHKPNWNCFRTSSWQDAPQPLPVGGGAFLGSDQPCQHQSWPGHTCNMACWGIHVIWCICLKPAMRLFALCARFFALMLFVQCILEIAWFCFEACCVTLDTWVIKQNQTFACLGVVMHQDGTGNFKEICLMIWNEVMLGITFATHDPMICGKKGLKSCSLKFIILWGLLNFSFTCLGCVLGPWGKRSTDNTTAVNLFYIMLSLNIHLWACGVVASYVPQLS